MTDPILKKQPMPTRPAADRIRDFGEVALGYTAEQAVQEAKRCLQCKHKPCVGGCPVQIDIPAFVGKVAEGDFAAAYDVLIAATALPAVCGRVCPQENQCEGKCVRGIKGEPVAIGRLERFVADWHYAQGKPSVTPPAPNGKRVAVVGSGPSGLACAGELAKRGYAVTVYEALHTAGGVLVYGIPAFRLPKEIVRGEIDNLRALGVNFETNTVIGRTFTVDELLSDMGYSAVYLGTGAGLPKFMGIPGEQYNGVCSANEYLTRVNLMGAYRPESDTPLPNARRVAVVGGGNVAMDAARCARRMGAEVTVVYRRGMEELPARKEEIEHALEEGIIFKTLTNPVEILAKDGTVSAIRCVRMTLGEPDASGRRRPVTVPDSTFEMETDCVIMALGTSPNPLIRRTTEGLTTRSWGGIIADEDGATSRAGIYAGGDAVTGAATVILAMGAGKRAAAAIHARLTERSDD